MNGVASFGIGYNGREISLSGYTRFNFNATKIVFHNNKYEIHFGERPTVLVDEIDKSYYVNELYLFVNDKKIGVQKVGRNTLNASTGIVYLPNTCLFNVYREER